MKFRAMYGKALILSTTVLLAAGCVSTGTYKAKEQESLELKKSLEATKGDYSELQEKNKKLADESDAMTLKLKKLDADFAELKGDSEKLKADYEKLAADYGKLKLENEKLTTAMQPENLLKTVVDSFAALKAENGKLKQALAAAEKAPANKEAEPPVRLSPVVSKPVGGGDDAGEVKAVKSPASAKESFETPKEPESKAPADEPKAAVEPAAVK